MESVNSESRELGLIKELINSKRKEYLLAKEASKAKVQPRWSQFNKLIKELEQAGIRFDDNEKDT